MPARCDVIDLFPSLYAFLADTTWDDGAARRTGSLLLCTEDGMWKCWLNDRAFARTCWLSGETLTEVLTSADRGLERDSLTWRADRKGAPGSGRKH